MSKLNQKEFLRKYNLDEDALERAKLEWQPLMKIFDDHVDNMMNLETTARYVSDNLRQVAEVHSLKYRVKDPEHLIEKVIRKPQENPSLDIQPDNYREKITDLIGVRALHLFKQDWIPIHSFITATWDLAEKPTANIREGDSKELIKQFEEHGCEINPHPYGYRSVHYLVRSQPTKESVVAEVQVRTIFEEGWSEIDHKTRYPYNLNNVVLGALLDLFNRLAGSADEMGTFVNFLRNELETRDKEHAAQLKELNVKIEKLEIDSRKKQDLQKQVDRLTAPYSVATSPAFEGLRKALASQSMASLLQAIRATDAQRRLELNKAISAITSVNVPLTTELTERAPKPQPQEQSSKSENQTQPDEKPTTKTSKKRGRPSKNHRKKKRVKGLKQNA